MEFAIVYMFFALLQAFRHRLRSALWFAVGVAVCFIHWGLMGIDYENLHCMLDHYHTCADSGTHELSLGDLAILKHTMLFVLSFCWGWVLCSLKSVRMAYFAYALSLHQFAMMVDSYNSPTGGTLLYEMYSPSIFMFNVLIILAGLSENSDDRGLADVSSSIGDKNRQGNGEVTK